MSVKTFSDGVYLPASDINSFLANAGLVYVTSATVGSAVSSVTVSNCFSSTYDDYRVIWSGGTMSANTQMSMRLGSSTTGYYGGLQYVIYGTSTNYAASDNNGDRFTWAGGGDTINALVDVTLFGPYRAASTRMNSQTVAYSTLAGSYVGVHGVSTSYSAVTILPGSGTMTGGTVTVYGYRKA